MATEYMTVVNDILGEMGEVRLTSSNFATATNIQASIKEFVNRAYFDLNNPTNKWPWLAVNGPQNNFYGNKYIETVAGTRWYLLNEAALGVNDDYGFVDWENFALTTEGVAGESAPYIVRNLGYINLDEWRDHFAIREEQNKHDSNSYDTPRRVFRSPDNRRFGISPIPDKVYRIYFFAYNRPVSLSAYNDELVLPDQYVTVLKARTRYYAWQRKENPNQAAIAQQEYETGLRAMKQQEISPNPDRITDDRIWWV